MYHAKIGLFFSGMPSTLENVEINRCVSFLGILLVPAVYCTLKFTIVRFEYREDAGSTGEELGR